MDISFDLGGIDAIGHDVDDLERQEITVGLHSDSGIYTKGKHHMSLVDVYMINALGSSKRNIPPRPFMNITMDENREAINGLMIDAARKMINEGAPQLQTVGAAVRKMMYDTVYNMDKLTPNAPSTINKKGFDWPMVETGQMIEALAYKLRE